MATPLRQKALELIQAKGRVSTAEMLTALTEGTEASKTFVKMHVLGPLRRKGLIRAVSEPTSQTHAAVKGQAPNIKFGWMLMKDYKAQRAANASVKTAPAAAGKRA